MVYSKPLDSRLAGNGYEASWARVSSDLDTLDSYVRYLSCWEATVRDRSIDKYDTFHFCG